MEDFATDAAIALERLRERGWTIGTAESCTGGLLGHLLTNVAGASDVYLGGVIAYANSVKQGVLSVAAATIDNVGAVSAEAAAEMAQGVRERLGVDVGIATTGIAGPGGGTPHKPVGLVYLGLATPEGVWTERHLWEGDRNANKAQTVERALTWLTEHLKEAGDEH